MTLSRFDKTKTLNLHLIMIRPLLELRWVQFSLCPYAVAWKIKRYQPGAQPALHFVGGGNFHEISFDDVIVLIQPWYNYFANGHSSLRNFSKM